MIRTARHACPICGRMHRWFRPRGHRAAFCSLACYTHANRKENRHAIVP
jgi:endogenous inhibitor of DNA gyrase (YacG/DUF329 family)